MSLITDLTSIRRSQLGKNIVSGGLSSLIAVAAAATSYRVYLQYLGLHNYGLWLVLATVLMFAQLGTLGLGPALCKLVAEEYERGDLVAMERHLTTALVTLFVAGSVVLLLTLLARNPIIAAFKLSGADAQLIFRLLPYIGVLSVYAFMVEALSATLSGLGRMDQANYVNVGGQVMVLAISAPLLHRGWGVDAMLLAYAGYNVTSSVVTFVLIRRIVRIRLISLRRFSGRSIVTLVRFGGGVLGSTLLAVTLNPVNKLLLSRYAGVSAIPIYDFAMTAAMKMRGVMELGLRALIPEMSRLAATGNREELARLHSVVLGRIMKYGIPFFATAIILAGPALRVWLKGTCEPQMIVCFRFMAFGAFLSLVGVPSFYTFLGVGRVTEAALSNVVQTAVNLAVIFGLMVFFRFSAVHAIAGATCGMAAFTTYLLWRARTLQTLDAPPGVLATSADVY